MIEFKIDKLQDKIIKTIKEIDVEGNNRLIDFIIEAGFFEAPASINHHLNSKGGLLIHSWLVYDFMKEFNQRFNMKVPEKSIFLEGIFHDICKINIYKKGAEPPTKKQIKYLDYLVKNNDMPLGFDYSKVKRSKNAVSDWINYFKNGGDIPDKVKDSWHFEDDLPLGHGEKSVILLQNYIKLNEREQLAIRWHMGPWEESVLLGNRRNSLNQAREMYPDVGLLSQADGLATMYEYNNNIEIS
ncbi:MAG TPA: hypothetical protein VJ962_09815 [Clostridia bacterium]|nr:hypothetical protein [Clostridia bacterium]